MPRTVGDTYGNKKVCINRENHIQVVILDTMKSLFMRPPHHNSNREALVFSKLEVLPVQYKEP